MEASIDKIFEYLSSYNSSEVQEYGIDLAGNIHSLSVFIMPIESTLLWENCAKILIKKQDEELELYYPELLEWLQDMKWPGADLIYDRLVNVSNEYFTNAYEYCLLLAKQTQDHPWEMALIDLLKDRKAKGMRDEETVLLSPDEKDETLE